MIDNDKRLLNWAISIDEELEKCKKTIKITTIIMSFLLFTCIGLLVTSIYFIKNINTSSTVILREVSDLSDESEIPSDIIEASEAPLVGIPLMQDISFSSEKPYIIFSNPEVNSGLFELEYVFTDLTGQLLMSTGWISTAKPVEVDMTKFFVEGNTPCTVNVNSRNIDSQESSNGATFNINVDYKKG